MRRRDVAQKIEPEDRQLREHPALVRDSGGQDVIECRDPVGGDDQQLAVNAINVADFATAVALDAGQIRLQNDSIVRGFHSSRRNAFGGVT